MPELLTKNLDLIKANPAILQTLSKLQRGIEKESLRIYPDGKLAVTGHPKSLGSALCHPRITTDYSESLLEFITPVHSSISGCLNALEEVHRHTYQALAKENELLWLSSMPCQLVKEKDIPIAQYGTSNVAKMKSVYRLGLGLRYGRMMQTISGIHYNFSLSDKFWTNYQMALGNVESTQDFKTEKYFGLIRNFRRLAPIFVYLFGASPALCKSFIQGQNHKLEPFDGHSWYHPHATSLRMGDLGYQSNAQEALFVCYNSLENYVSTLRRGINEPHQDYEKFGLKDADANYHQLNTSLLQIENEFYSIIRPKRVAASGEAPIHALSRRGVEYVEIRCIDINPFTANGIDQNCMRFLDLLLLYCLFSDSPLADEQDCSAASENLKKVVQFGRDPALTIEVKGEAVNFREFAQSTLEGIDELAKTLDSLRANQAYSECLQKQLDKVANSNKTPSAKVLKSMKTNKLTFAQFGRQQSLKWQQHFLQRPLSDNKQAFFDELTANSLAEQLTLEKAGNQDFANYLNDFYQQYKV